jgi:hypothetical protein
MTAEENTQNTGKEEDHSKVLDPKIEGVAEEPAEAKKKLTKWQKFKRGCKIGGYTALVGTTAVGASSIVYNSLPEAYQEAIKEWTYDTIVAPFNGSEQEEAQETAYEKRLNTRISQLEKDARTRINTLSDKLNAANARIKTYEDAEKAAIKAREEAARKKAEEARIAEEAKKKAEEQRIADEERKAEEAREREEEQRRQRVLDELIKYRNDLASKSYELETANKKIKTYEEQEKYRKAVEEKKRKRKSLINLVISKLMAGAPQKSRMRKSGDLYRAETLELEEKLEEAFNGTNDEFYIVLGDIIKETKRRENRLRLGLPMYPTEEEKAAQENAENQEETDETVGLGDVLDVLTPVPKPEEKTEEKKDEVKLEDEVNEDNPPVIIK